MIRRIFQTARNTQVFRRGQRKWFRFLLSLRGTPESVGLGFALGVFVACTPTIGLHLVLAVALATLLRASRPAALLATWISNPATFPPFYLSAYKVGAWLIPGPPVSEVRETLMRIFHELGSLQFGAFLSDFKVFLSIGMEILGPMMLGGILVGLVAGALTYPVVLLLFEAFHNFREKRRAHRSRHRPHLYHGLHAPPPHLDGPE
jgi:uncharacterized protein (DUF2062 family)